MPSIRASMAACSLMPVIYAPVNRCPRAMWWMWLPVMRQKAPPMQPTIPACPQFQISLPRTKCPPMLSRHQPFPRAEKIISV